ncbi:hypothetical protein LTR70_010170 [Exophiala xenobiotica]|uniref:Uncharacterized protein n=1 Tax=Lithohypha guttulata TaxID=1690604 RepID=A0ABR0JVK8_9EURO|nr:hypothetical protein LTR24_010121 [Lithohypha guttulata]KAK5309580.1 hypothetical protein LTR70_010170 [Exophiala xenobiotica]
MNDQQDSSGYSNHNVYGLPSVNQYSHPTTFHPQQTSTFPTPDTLQKTPRECHLETGIRTLKRQLVLLSTQRWNETQAYNAFVDRVHVLNQVLPPHHQTPQYREAWLKVLDASQNYALAQSQAQQLPVAYFYQQTAIHQPTLERRRMVPDATADRKLQSQRAKDDIATVKSDLKPEIILISRFLQSINYHLQPPISNIPAVPQRAVVTDPRHRLAISAGALENNIASFTSFLTSYLNGRHEIVSKDLQPKLKNLLEPFFSDPRDAQTLLSAIVNETKAIVKVETGHVKMLSQDLIAPMTELLAALVGVLEGWVESCG